MTDKRVTILLTGGTIGSAVENGGETLPAGHRSQELQLRLERIFSGLGVNVSFRFPWGCRGLDSSNLQPWHWVDLTRYVVEELDEGAAAIVILHGTDTMAYSAAWLSLALGDVDRPVIFTGSQLTLDSVADDVTVNLQGAATVAASALTGVWIYFNWKLFQGRRVHKARAVHPDAFVAVGGIPLYFTPDLMRRHYPMIVSSQRRSRSPELERILSLDETALRELRGTVAWVSSAPGLVPRFSGDEKVLLLLGHGAGNASSLLMEEVTAFWKGRDKPLLLACSLAEGDEKRPDIYGEVGLAELAREGFPLWAQGDYPLELIHALAWFALAGCPNDPGGIFSRYLRRF